MNEDKYTFLEEFLFLYSVSTSKKIRRIVYTAVRYKGYHSVHISIKDY